MPLYEYRCSDCSLLFEELVRNTATADVRCPRCRTASVVRQMSVFAAPAGPVNSACYGPCAQGGACDVPPAARPAGGGGCCGGGGCSH